MANSITRIITFVFGALPATALALVAVVMLSFPMTGAFLTSSPVKSILSMLPFLLVMIFGLLGASGLWIAALGPNPVSSKTAVRIILGIIAFVIFALFMSAQISALGAYSVSILGPIVVGSWHLLRWRGAI